MTGLPCTALDAMPRFSLGGRAALAALFVLNVLNYLDRYVAAALLPLILSAFALSDTQGGALHFAVITAFTLVAPVAGFLGSRLPRLRLAGCAAIVWSAATFASGLAPTFTTLLTARALVGVGEATYSVIGPTLIADYTAPPRRARALAIFYVAIPIGSALGFLLGGWTGTAFGYERAFFLAGAPGLLLGLALFAFREPVRGQFDGYAGSATGLRLAQTVRALMHKRAFVYNTVAQTLYTFALGGLAYWMPTFYTRRHGLPLARATFVFGAILTVAGLCGTLAGGWLGDRLAARRTTAYFSFSGFTLLAALPSSLLAVLAVTPVVYWSGLGVALFLLFLNMGPLNAAMVNALPPDLRERAFGINAFTIHALGDAVSPIVIGLVSDRTGLGVPITLTAIVLSASGAVLLAGRHALRRDLAVLSSINP